MRTKTALNFLELKPGVSQSDIQEAFESLYYKYCDPTLPEHQPMMYIFSEISKALATYDGGEVRGFTAHKGTLDAMRKACAWLIQENKVFVFKGSWTHVEDDELTPDDWETARQLGFKPRTRNRSTWAFHVPGDESRGRGGFTSSEIDSKYGSHIVNHAKRQQESQVQMLNKKQKQDEEDEELKQIPNDKIIDENKRLDDSAG